MPRKPRPYSSSSHVYASHLGTLKVTHHYQGETYDRSTLETQLEPWKVEELARWMAGGFVPEEKPRWL